MMPGNALDLIALLTAVNRLLSSAIVVTGFSLTIYILTHNLRSPVARAFAALMSFVTLVYVSDFVLLKVTSAQLALPWLKMQWLGIPFVPAAYLHFSDALLVTTNARSRLRRVMVWCSYFIGIGLVLLAILTKLLVREAIYLPAAPQLRAGPLFWLFAIYFFFTVGAGALNIQRARNRCLTPTSRRRMTYLALAFVAPALGVFPYVMLASVDLIFPPAALLSFVLLGNVGVALMMIVMTYPVAYFGVLLPDRVVKQRLVSFMLRGPLAAVVVIALLQTVPKVETILGLSRDTVLFTTVVAGLVLLQVAITVAQPLIDRLLYRRERNEIAWLRQLDNRLLTTTDMQQFLENLLSAVCDTLRVTTAFVAVIERDGPRRHASYGREQQIDAFLAGCDTEALIQTGDLPALPPYLENLFNGAPPIVRDGFWVFPLRATSGDITLGVLGVQAHRELIDLSEEEANALVTLVAQAENALADRHLQQSLFGALEQIIPEIEIIQRRRGTVRYAGSPPVQPIDESLIYAPEFPQLVKDALRDYWGGPKLSDSPLLGLSIVKKALLENQGQPAQALRAVLLQAVEALRPGGERKMTTREWLLYNILDLKFLRGERVSYVASRLAMSESDLYRKQRVAIQEVARTLAQMEEEAWHQQPDPANHDGAISQGPKDS
ncbi:MAG: histidine kinase N-terminal 7TM domain-containing protein [Chloroflexota bacterium]